MFEAERARILSALPGFPIGLEHIGSTSVPGLPAKPIIDLLLGVGRLDAAVGRVQLVEALGYERVPWVERLVPGRLYFDRGPAGSKQFHLHVVEFGSKQWIDPILFRDWLRAHPADAQAYGDLKRELEARFPGPGEAYGDAKRPFVLSILERAQREAASP